MPTHVAKFQSLFWFLNPKIKKGEKLYQNEVGLVTTSLNMTSGSLRLDFYPEDVKNWIHGSGIFLENKKLLTKTALYPASLYALKTLQENEKYECMEELKIAYNPTIPDLEWQDTLSTCFIERYSDLYKIIIIDKKKSYFYLFKDRQEDMLKYMANYCLTYGQQLTGIASINK